MKKTLKARLHDARSLLRAGRCVAARERVEKLLKKRLSSAQREEAYSIALSAQRCLAKTYGR